MASIKPNHIALNMITKGLARPSSLVTKGFIDANVRYEIIIVPDPGTGTGTYPEPIGGGGGGGKIVGVQFPKPIDVTRHGLKPDDVEVIRVFVDWKKGTKKEGEIYAKLLQKEITTEFLGVFGTEITIEVNLEE